MKTYPYGAVLKVTREFSLEDIFGHMRSMRKLGMDFIVIWPAIFWFEDKSYPDYPYHTGKEILKYAGEIGLKVIMELAGQIPSLEYAPDFLLKEEYYVVSYDGRYDREEMDLSYGYVNYNHPEVKLLVEKLFKEAAAIYKDYPALYGYDIWNETWFTSYDKYTLQFFREWLKAKYKSIDKLNNIWDRAYHDWSQIHFSRWMWASVMPVVDYQQFHKENVGILLKEWNGYIKSVDGLHPVIADNIGASVTMDCFYDRPQDDWNVGENVDEIGLSFYPKIVQPGEPHYWRWETLSQMHSVKESGHFWVSELQSHHQTMYNPFSVVYPHELRWWNWEAVSHGAKGIMYWKWEPFTKGNQTFGRGLLDIRGNYTSRAREAEKICRIIKENEREFAEYEPELAKAAILYDTLNHDFSKAFLKPYESFLPSSIYIDSITGLYRCMWEQNIPAMFVTPKDIINGRAGRYKLIFISNQMNVDIELANALKRYVEEGGVLVCDGRFGVIGNDGIMYDGQPGGALNETLGYNLIDVEPNNLDITMKDNSGYAGKLSGYYEKQYLEVFGSSAEVLGTFDEGSPAVIRSRAGKGEILYIATYLWYGYFKENSGSVSDFMKGLAAEYDMAVNTISCNDLKIRALKGDDGLILFAFNYENREVAGTVELKGIQEGRCNITDLYAGAQSPESVPVNGGRLSLNLTVKANDVRIYKVAHIAG